MPDAATVPTTVRPARAAEMLGISRLKVYRLLREGQLRSVKEGNTRLVFTDSIQQFLINLEQGVK